MTVSAEIIKDWIREGYDKNAVYMFIVKNNVDGNVRPYWANPGENVEVIREMIIQSGEEVVNELNLDVKLLFLQGVNKRDK